MRVFCVSLIRYTCNMRIQYETFKCKLRVHAQGLNFNRSRLLSIITCTYDTLAQRYRPARLYCQRNTFARIRKYLSTCIHLYSCYRLRGLATLVQCKAFKIVNVLYITVFTQACYWSLLSATCIRSTASLLTYLMPAYYYLPM